MAAGNKILGFAVRIANEAGDVLDEVKDDLQDVEKAAVDAGKEVGSFGGRLFETAEAGGNAEQALRGTSDILNFMGEQFGVQVGAIGEWSAALADVGGGVEGLLKGGPALVGQLKTIPGAIGPAIAGSWSYVAALYAQAAAFIVANAPIILIIGGIALLAAGIVLLITHWDTITEKVPILGTAVDRVKDVVITAKDLLIGALTTVPDWLRDNWPLVATLISGPFAPIVLLATDGFGVRSALIGAFNDVLNFLAGLPGQALELATSFGAALADGIASGFGSIVDKAGDMGGAVIGAFRSAWNSAIQFADDNFKLHIPGVSVAGKTIIPDIDWNPDLSFLKLATGGIVTRPTFALIGEAGPEAVVPLSGPNAPGGFGAQVHIHIEGPVYGVDDLIYTLDRALKRAGQPGLVAA